MSAAKINRPRRVSLAGLMVALLLAATATLGSHCPAGAVDSAIPTAAADTDGAHHGTARKGHRLDEGARLGGTGSTVHRSVTGEVADHRGAARMAHGSMAGHGGTARLVFPPVVDQVVHPGSPAESGSTGLVALCVSVAVAVLLAMVRLGQPPAVGVRAAVGRPSTAIASLVWPSPDPVRLCVLRT